MYARTIVVIAVAAMLVGCTMTYHEAAGKPAATSGTLSLAVNVRGASVYIDDSLYGESQRAGKAQDFIVPAGTHKLVVKKFGFVDYAVTIGIAGGGVNTLDVTLNRQPTEAVKLPEAPAKAPEKAVEPKK